MKNLVGTFGLIGTGTVGRLEIAALFMPTITGVVGDSAVLFLLPSSLLKPDPCALDGLDGVDNASPPPAPGSRRMRHTRLFPLNLEE
jgi:hypothetical protein